MKDNTQPIGFFDSGLGGLSVWLEVVQRLPHEDIIYFADSGNCPYGNRSKEEIIELSIKNTEFLLEKGAKLIVVACNTATAAAIETLRNRYEVPFIGMEPAVKPAAMRTLTGKIGVLATKGTLESERFKDTKNKYAKGVEVMMQVGQGLVEIVENQTIAMPETEVILKRYLDPMIVENIDKLVLGCTHYPFLMPILEKILPPHIEIINPAPAVARQVVRQIERYDLLNDFIRTPKYEFHTSGDIELLHRFLQYLNIDF